MRRVLGINVVVMLSCALLAGTAYGEAEKKENPYGGGAKIWLNKKTDSWMRFITWAQVWARYTEFNPATATAANGSEEGGSFDVGVRRARLLILAQLAKRVRMVFHIGINNQTFRASLKKQQMFLHDGWVEFDVFKKYLSIGGGLTYWNGISRLTNQSTLNMLTVDAPITNWPTIELTDQFARQLGIYFKGQIAGFDYRLSFVRPFESGNANPGPVAVNNPRANTMALSGYFQYQFLDKESNLLPYAVGTYLGSKKIFNLGLGFHYHPHGTWSQATATSARERHDIFLLGADAFLDMPLSKLGALTAYLVYYYYDFGPNYLRNIGIMNYGVASREGTPSLNGPGNGYPSVGSGHAVYFQTGYLFNAINTQPYVAILAGLWDALDDPALVFEAGATYYMYGHHAKFTLHWRNRPIFMRDAVGGQANADSRANELILQMHVFI